MHRVAICFRLSWSDSRQEKKGNGAKYEKGNGKRRAWWMEEEEEWALRYSNKRQKPIYLRNLDRINPWYSPGCSRIQRGTNRNLEFPQRRWSQGGWKGRKGRRYSLEFAFGLRNLHERETRRVWPRRAAVVSGPSLLLFHVQSGRRRLFIDCSTDTRRKRERERKSQAFISQVTRARDWRSIKGRFTRPDSDANRRKINTAYYSVRINRSTWAMSTNAISFCSKRVDIRGMRWPRSRRPGTDRPRSESLIEPRRRRPRRRPLSFVLSNARDVKNVDRALDYIAVYRTQIEEERSSSLRTIFAITRPCTHLEIIGNLLLCKALHTRVSKKC